VDHKLLGLSNSFKVASDRVARVFLLPAQSFLTGVGQSLTDVKVKQAMFHAAASLSFFGAVLCGALAYGLSSWAFGLTVFPLSLVGGAIFLKALMMVDGEDPLAVERLRSDAQGKGLEELVKEYGWDQLFRYEIMSEAKFERSYRSHVDRLPFLEILFFYREAKHALEAVKSQNGGQTVYKLPAPSEWRGKFRAETKDLRCDQIVRDYPLSELTALGILTKLQQAALDDAVKELASYRQKSADLEEQFLDRTLRENMLRCEAKERAEREFNAQFVAIHETLKKIQDAQTNQCRALEKETQQVKSLEERNFALHKRMLAARRLGALNAEDGRELAVREEGMNNRIRILGEEESAGLKRIAQEFAAAKEEAQALFERARIDKNQKYAQAEHEFRLSTADVRREIDLLLAKEKAAFEKNMKDITQRYRN
jgi:hypothetical protein